MANEVPQQVTQNGVYHPRRIFFVTWAARGLSAILASTIAGAPSSDVPPIALWSGPPITAEMAVQNLSDATHHIIHSADDHWQYLHGISLAMADGQLVASWENGNEVEHDEGCAVRGRWSTEGASSWNEPFRIDPINMAQRPQDRRHRSHGVMWTHDDVLNMLVTTFERKGYKSDTGEWVGTARPNYQLTYQDLQTERWVWNAQTGSWDFTGPFVSGIFPSGQPKRLPDGGGWAMGGFDTHGHPSVVRWPAGQPQDFQVATIPVDVNPTDPLRFGETDVLVSNDTLIAITRYQTNAQNNPGHGLVSRSTDGGISWTRAQATNFPMAASRPCAGRLTTGEPYLIFNPWDRNQLAIAMGPVGGIHLDRLLMIRSEPPPEPRFPAFSRPQWSYPSAVEFGDHLLVAYSASKEDAVLTIIPLSELRKRPVVTHPIGAMPEP